MPETIVNQQGAVTPAPEPAQTPAAAVSSAEQPASPSAEVNNGAAAPAAEAGITAGKQTAEENHKFAAFRRKVEAAEAKASQYEAGHQSAARLKNLLSSELGISGSDDEIADKLISTARGITVEQARAERVAGNAKIADAVKNDPEYIRALQESERYKAIVVEQMMTEDLNKLKAAYPDIKISSLNELDPGVGDLVKIGWDIVDAYAAVDSRNKRHSPAPVPVPEALPSLTSNTIATEREYYTKEEAKKLTLKDLDDKKIMEKVMKSMTKWK